MRNMDLLNNLLMSCSINLSCHLSVLVINTLFYIVIWMRRESYTAELMSSQSLREKQLVIVTGLEIYSVLQKRSWHVINVYLQKKYTSFLILKSVKWINIKLEHNVNILGWTEFFLPKIHQKAKFSFVLSNQI